MRKQVTVDEFLQRAQTTPILDVRSPGEFAQAHIPGAVNVPLFDDAERAEVGTIYKQVGKEAAIKRGLKLVRPKLTDLVERSQRAATGPKVLVHCWRGGMRSENFAMLLESSGFEPFILEGGYKSYRREAHRYFAEPLRMVILSGLTGAGKTQMLHDLKNRGEQIIDLENLACHRGSAFGAIAQPPQPTVEQFENDLFAAWRNIDPERIVWLEDEGQSIGRVFLPRPVWTQMSEAPAIFLKVDLPQRTAFLLKEYGKLDRQALSDSINKIKKRLGGARWQAAQSMLDAGEMRPLTELLLQYYDTAYYHAQANRGRARTTEWPLSYSADPSRIDELRDLARSLLAHPV